MVIMLYFLYLVLKFFTKVITHGDLAWQWLSGICIGINYIVSEIFSAFMSNRYDDGARVG